MSGMLVLILWLASTAAQAGVPEVYQASYDLEAAQDYRGALVKMDDLSGLGEDDYVVHLRRGWLLYLVGRYADAVQAYKQAEQRAPGSVEARTGLLLPLMALRRWAEAEAECRSILEVAPHNYLASSRLAYVLYSSGRYADAATQYGAVLKRYPSDVEMRTGLGWSQLKQGRSDAARSTFMAVLRVAPSHVSAGQGLAEAR
ncbi:MAG: tetratricopeptide (TPR) repeat protein [Myxococcota bacterium]|jgi:tetratricopeptide (TPR) repeat protein